MNPFPVGIEQLVVKLQDQIMNITPLPPSTEWFDWQSLPLSWFYAGMLEASKKLGPGRHKFLDVGSGIGTKLYLADSLGFDPYGIEHNADYVDISRTLWPEYPVYLVNALDYVEYDAYDVIYSYRLARNDDLQRQVNEHIVQHMREGAIFFANDTSGSIDTLMNIDGVSALDANMPKPVKSS
jgi:SAM-dependent methyltransferase